MPSNHDFHFVLAAEAINGRVQIVNVDADPIGDRSNRTIWWMPTVGNDLGALFVSHRNKPAVLATFDIHYLLVSLAGEGKLRRSKLHSSTEPSRGTEGIPSFVFQLFRPRCFIRSWTERPAYTRSSYRHMS